MVNKLLSIVNRRLFLKISVILFLVQIMSRAILYLLPASSFIGNEKKIEIVSYFTFGFGFILEYIYRQLINLFSNGERYDISPVMFTLQAMFFFFSGLFMQSFIYVSLIDLLKRMKNKANK